MPAWQGSGGRSARGFAASKSFTLFRQDISGVARNPGAGPHWDDDEDPFPSVDCIGALKALRRTHAPEGHGGDTLALGAKCLNVLIAELTEEGVPPADLQPLVDLEALLLRLKAQAQGEGGANRRKRRPPSQSLLARASALIDLLIKAGYDESKAAQTVMRLRIAAGVPPPQQGGDARGWERLLEWRTDLAHGIVSAEAQGEYEDFTREIDSIPATERVKRVVDEHLWDRRRKPR